MPNWNSSAPFEIIASPATLYLAPALTARPTITTYPYPTPAGPWALIGTDGELNYTEDGVKISQPQDVTELMMLGDTAPRKAVRVKEGVMVEVNVADLTLEAWKLALNSNTITPTAAGVAAGAKKIGLSRGPGVGSFALLVVFPSPYGLDLWSHIWLPRAINKGASEFDFRKGVAAALKLQFSAMVNADASSEDERLGVIEAQTEPPTT